MSLGDYDFTGTGDEHVLLGDNTGEAASTNAKIAFDAVRVQPLDAPMEPGGGCSGCTSGSGGATFTISCPAS